jgi:proline racemase
MKISKTINAIDSHTMGEPTRIVVGGIPKLKGRTMAEKKQFLIDKFDCIRTGIMHEPRGHANMFGSVITQPCDDEADFGIIFMDGGGYLNMCGHGSIGAITVAIETGMIKSMEPVTEVVMDTPAGIVKGKAKVKDGKVEEVSIVNVPSFLYKKEAAVDAADIGKIRLDVSFGGSFFAIVHAGEIGLEIVPENAAKLTEAGLKIRDAVNRQVEIKHPELSYITTCDLVEFYDSPTHPDANYKNVVVFGQGQIDRSPCGTGTSAKLATLYAKGQLKQNELFVYESILGTMFKGRILGTAKVGDFDAIIPEITGAAYITGFSTFMFDESDPVKYGFVL